MIMYINAYYFKNYFTVELKKLIEAKQEIEDPQLLNDINHLNLHSTFSTSVLIYLQWHHYNWKYSNSQLKEVQSVVAYHFCLMTLSSHQVTNVPKKTEVLLL